MHPRMTPRRTARSFGSLCKGCAYWLPSSVGVNTEYKRLTDQRVTYSTHEHHSSSSAARLFRLRQNDAVCAKTDHSTAFVVAAAPPEGRGGTYKWDFRLGNIEAEEGGTLAEKSLLFNGPCSNEQSDGALFQRNGRRAAQSSLPSRYASRCTAIYGHPPNCSQAPPHRYRSLSPGRLFHRHLGPCV